MSGIPGRSDPASLPPVSGELRIGPYLLGRKLGEGGMGIVYLAHDPQLDRDVAIKVLRLPRPVPQPVVQRFIREAKATARLNHPNIVTIHQFGDSDGQLYLVMEHIEGGSLADELGARGRLPWRQATAAIRDAGVALAVAHQAGLIHRDIKPSNLMRSSREIVKLVDFGLARACEPDVAITQAGIMVGTPQYMAPEQFGTGTADARSDLYALTCTYYTLLTGNHPFDGEDVTKVWQQHLQEPFPDPRRLVGDIPEPVWKVLECGGRKEPDQRFQNAGELIAALNAILSDPATALREPIAAPALRRGTISNNLPAEVTSFIGRAQVLADALNLLEQTRLLTLTGPGGSGKTRLAQRIAAEIMARFPDRCPDGVWFVDLAGVGEAALVAQATARAVGVGEEPGRPLVETLCEALCGRKLLLVLDNCEHVIEPCAALAEALMRCGPKLCLITTSREALGLSGETQFPVLPLSVPSSNQAAPDLMDFEAVKLFVERAAAIRPGFALTASTAPAVLQICRDLDGIPLAIELAAARVNVMGVEQIAVRLADRFHLLSVGSRTALPRQKTLRALIDWSYDLLADPERRLLARLSVFVGGWSLEAAEAVGTETDAWAVLDALTQLVAKSLVNAEDAPNAAGTGDAKRYRLLETVRTYAREKLAGEDELATRSRHLEFFLQLAQTALPHLRGPESAQWVHRLDTEHDNLRAALDWASQSPQRHAAGLRLATTLHRFWYQRGYLVEGLQRLEQFLKVGDAQTTEPAIRAPALLAASALAHFQGDLQRATSLSDQGRSLYQSLGDAEGITLCLRASARVAVQSGDYARAEELLVEIVERLRPLKDPDGLVAQGEAAHNLALALVYQGYHHRALPYLEQATALARESGDRRQMAVMLAAKAFISIFGGAYDEADSACRQALPIFEEFGDQYRIANAHYLIAMNQTWRGDIDSAIKSCDHTLALLSQIKEKWLTVLTLILRGQLAVRQGDLALGAELCEKSLKLAPVGGDHRGADVALAVLGVIAAQKGDLPRAANLFAQSLRLTQRLPDWRHAAECMEVLAGVAVGNNQAERAARLLGAAAALREQLGCPVPTVEKSDLEKTRASARQMLGDQAFAAARDAGAALDRAQAVHLALDGVG